MDPIGSINIKKDSSFAMLLAAQARGWSIAYMEQSDLFLRDGLCHARIRGLRVEDKTDCWFEFTDESLTPLSILDVVLLRKDPPVDTEYFYTTYMLERAETGGTLIVNRPSSIRSSNEKLFTSWFPHCCPPTLVSRSMRRLRSFLDEHEDIILKPLDGMGGASVFHVSSKDPNISVILETLTKNGTKSAMAQLYLPEIKQGDKRILLIDGEPVPYALARIPAPGETRGNLAAGATGKGIELSKRDRWICNEVGPVLRERGLVFVGIDVIGDYLTEINVTSPTCIRELDKIYGLDIAGDLMNNIENRLE